MDLVPSSQNNLPELLTSNLDIDKLSTEDKDELISVLEDLVAPRITDYIPHAKQELFHAALQKYRLLSGGNRSGKTEAGTMEDIYHATGLYPNWYPKEGRFKTATHGRVIVTDYKEGGAIFEKKLLTWLPKNLIVQIKRVVHVGVIERISIRHISGDISTIEILSNEQPDNVFEGWSGHWAHFDEPPQRNKFIATIRGLIDYRGRCWLTLTPINEPWLYDQFVYDEETKDVFFMTVDIKDNPYIPLKEVEDFEKQLTEDEKEARLHGRFKHLVGRVYKEFDPVIHLLSKDKTVIKPDWTVYFACDPADRRPHVGIWARVNPFGTIYVVDEICYQGTIQNFSKEILKRELMNKINPMDVIRILDPNKGNTPTAITGLKLVDEFAKYAIYFNTNVNDDITTGHLAVKQRLSYDKTKPISFTNMPKLFFIKETTLKCIKQLQSYVWDDWKDSGRDQKEKPKDVNKDFPDTLRYLVMFNPVWFNKHEPDPYIERSSRTGY